MTKVETTREIYLNCSLTQSHGFKVRSTGHFCLVPPDRERIRHEVDFGEIFWPLSGSCVFRLDGMEYTLRPGNVWYYPPGSNHDYFPKEVFCYNWLAISGSLAGALFDGFEIRPGLNRAGVCPEHLFLSVQKNLEQSRVVTLLNAMADAFRILSLIPATRHDSHFSRDSIEARARLLIEENFCDPDVNVSFIADTLKVNRSTLSRRFHATYGLTIQDFIVSRRLEHSVRLVTTTTLSTREIASKCGFNSLSYFTSTFTSKIGVPPGKYRAQQ